MVCGTAHSHAAYCHRHASVGGAGNFDFASACLRFRRSAWVTEFHMLRRKLFRLGYLQGFLTESHKITGRSRTVAKSTRELAIRAASQRAHYSTLYMRHAITPHRTRPHRTVHKGASEVDRPQRTVDFGPSTVAGRSVHCGPDPLKEEGGYRNFPGLQDTTRGFLGYMAGGMKLPAPGRHLWRAGSLGNR